MTGTIVVHAESPWISRSGTLGVVVDGTKIGEVRQGSTAHFPVVAGRHTLRVITRDRSRSNTVTLEVVEGQHSRVRAGGTGLAIATVLPALACIAVPPIFGMGAVLLTGVILYAVPGSLFRVRPEVDRDDRVEPVSPADPEEGGGAGLWWESDPALAKRFGNRPDR